jgi:hypothetical protein
MRRYLSQIISPAPLFYIFVFFAQIATGIHLVSRHEAPPIFQLIYIFGFLWIIGWWLKRDSRKQGVSLVFDTGLFLYVAWPVIMPYYLLKTRGAKGLITILGFLGVYLGGTIIGATIYLILIS